MIRKAREEDLSRIAEILVFVKRVKYRPIFRDDDYAFGRLQVLAVAKELQEAGSLEKMWVYDDGIVKGLIHLEGKEIAELYVDLFFEGQGVGSALIGYAKEQQAATFLWVIEKNTEAIRFYEAHGFALTKDRKREEGTSEDLVRMERYPSKLTP